MSHRSGSSGSSSASSRMRAKAESSKARAMFAQREFEMKKQLASIEEERIVTAAKVERLKSECAAELLLLGEQKEAAAAEAEANALEEISDGASLSIERENSAARTRQYLINLQQEVELTARTQMNNDQEMQSQMHETSYTPRHEFRHAPPHGSSYTQRREGSYAPQNVPTPPTDLARFLLKKDLNLSRLCVFNEKPEDFACWKTSFQAVMNDLEVSAEEELDLLIKHLGCESAKYARSIKSSNSSDPNRGLRLLWKRLEDRFGAPELIEARLRERVENFPQITKKDPKKFYDLCDLCDEINCAKNDEALGPLLKVYDTSIGANKIIAKLPYNLKQKWTERASNFKQRNGVVFPPFTFLVEFLQNVTKVQNDPAFCFENDNVVKSRTDSTKQSVSVRFVGVSGNEPENSRTFKCPIHRAGHSLAVCKAFGSKSFEEKRNFLKENKVCFRCLASSDHIARKCTETIKCDKCSKPHLAVMHRDYSEPPPHLGAPSAHGGEPHVEKNEPVSNKCTAVCGGKWGRSCGKVILTHVFRADKPEKSVRVYAVIDDQSNRSLASTDLLDQLDVPSEVYPYTLSSCSGTQTMSGRRAEGLCVQSFDKMTTLNLPSLIECDSIPQDRTEIPTRDVAHHHSHLHNITANIPPMDENAKISLLIGRDLIETHHVLEQVIGPPSAPFAQRLPLGWTIVGDVCLSKAHKPSVVWVNKTYVTRENRGTIFEPCPNHLKVSDADQLGTTVFAKTPEDEKIGMSVEDKKFVKLMDNEFTKDENDRWSAPLPFRSTEFPQFSNRAQAFNRAHGLDTSLKKNLVKREHFFKFMSKILNSGAAEKAPPLDDADRCWYLPLFGVYNSKKPGKIRGVFDSSAVFHGTSLNSKLFSGPDLSNSLVGILLRFRQDLCPLMADIEQMFYQFFVSSEHRNFLRFFWYENNDFSKPLVEYRMCVHVFGNSPSPAVATYGLRKTVESSEQDVKRYVCEDFYIDDGVTSVPDSEQAVDLMKRTKADLMEKGKLRLHKLASTDREFLKAFDTADLSEELQSIDLSDISVPLPVHSCLGLAWDLDADSFNLNTTVASGPFTRRGVLSALNGIYDPLGFLAPATIAGKILLREMSPNGKAWDEPLSGDHLQKWESWKLSFESVENLQVPRMYVSSSLTQQSNVEFHIFCDASEKAIATVAYVKVTEGDAAKSDVGFVMGKAKLAPSSGHTIPRLELCSAVLATELWQIISEHLGVAPKIVTFYSDSKVVLGYINNEKRRFHTYVSNRVDRIRSVSDPKQWKYIASEMNPADVATRASDGDLSVKQNVWLQGPTDILIDKRLSDPARPFPLISPDDDREIRANVCKTEINDDLPSVCRRFDKYSTWDALMNALCLLRHICRCFRSPTNVCKGWHQCSHYLNVDDRKATENFILTTAQNDAFAAEIQCLRKGSPLPKHSPIISLSPYLDQEGLLRVGGRLHEAKETIGFPSVHPVILPKDHHVSSLLAKHYHLKVKHQGRHFTEGAVCSDGFWIVGAKRLVASIIHQCLCVENYVES